jgi:membrane-bound lytic murein transglycosylase B
MAFSRTILGFMAAFCASPALAQECGGDFAPWKAGIRAEAVSAGVGQRGLDALDGAERDPNVIKRDRAQGVFSQTFIEFSGRMISSYRISQGNANLKKYAKVFDRMEQEYGVPRAVMTAFWALETDDCRRPELFRPHIVPLLTLIDRGMLPANVTGAWAGEIGQTQILPSDYLLRGVDGDGDGKVDLRNSEEDVIMTTGNKLLHRGWKRGEPWIEEVRAPAKMPWEETGRSNKLPISQWTAWGVTARDGGALQDRGLNAGLVLPMGHKGPAFLVYDNYEIYLQWNQSFTYTLTAAHFAARFAGAPKFDPRNPEQGLNQDQMKQLQTRLEALGYDVGGIDGILGVNTREAVRTEQKKHGFPVDGWPTPKLLAAI